jgi:hypothetical protein
MKKRNFGDTVGVIADAMAAIGNRPQMYRAFAERDEARTQQQAQQNYLATLYNDPTNEMAAQGFLESGGDIPTVAALQKANAPQRPRLVPVGGSVLALDDVAGTATPVYQTPEKPEVVKRDLRSVQGVGLVDATDPANPRVVMPARSLATGGSRSSGGGAAPASAAAPTGGPTKFFNAGKPIPNPKTNAAMQYNAILASQGPEAATAFMASGGKPGASGGGSDAPFSPTEVWGMLQEAGQNLPKASSGGLQTATTAAARFFGLTPDSASADTNLDLLGARLTTTSPRFQGPQSDKDVALYGKMAANLMDSSRTTTERESARQTMMRLIYKYSGPSGTTRPGYKEGMALPKEWRPPTERPPLSSFVK